MSTIRYEGTAIRRAIALLVVAGVFCPPASAALISFSVPGTVELADAGNAFDLGVGDEILVTGLFDDTAILPESANGIRAVLFGVDHGHRMTLNLGAITLTESHDMDFLKPGNLGRPGLEFFEGTAESLNFLARMGVNDSPVDFGAGSTFRGEDESGHRIMGFMNFGRYSAASVPEPATLGLLAFGLLSLRFFLRKPRTRGSFVSRLPA